MLNKTGIDGAIELLKLLVEKVTWKLIAQLSVATVLTGVFYITWDNRSRLSTIALSRWGYPEINIKRLPEAADGLSAELQPTTIFFWSVNVSSNTRRAIYVWANGSRRPELEGRIEMLFPDDFEGVNHVVRLVRGEEFCDELNSWTPLRTLLKDAGVVWGCAVAIPPEMSRLIGAITVGFSDYRPEEYSQIRGSIMRWAKYLTGEGW